MIIAITNWLDNIALPWLCKWLVGWPRYRLGACPACASDPSDEWFVDGECPVCEGKRGVTAVTWAAYKRSIHDEVSP